MNMQEAISQVTFYNNGVQAQKGSRWFKVYAAEPDSNRIVLEAGYDMMPADYREEHDSVEEALRSLQEVVDIANWQEAEF